MLKIFLKQITITFLIIFINSLIALSQETTRKICPIELNNAINSIINRPIFNRSRWGILVETLSGKRKIYRRDAEYYFTPASTAKLLTTAIESSFSMSLKMFNLRISITKKSAIIF